jgi:hypothetical protein
LLLAEDLEKRSEKSNNERAKEWFLFLKRLEVFYYQEKRIILTYFLKSTLGLRIILMILDIVHVYILSDEAICSKGLLATFLSVYTEV